MKLAKVLPEILINWLKHWSNHAEYYKLTEVFFIEFEHVPQRKTHLFKIVAFQAASVFFFIQIISRLPFSITWILMKLIQEAGNIRWLFGILV